MRTAFPWYVIHRDTKFIVAGFVEFSDAEKFCSAMSHDLYLVRDHATVALFHAA